MQHTITLTNGDEAALALKLERHNRNRAGRGQAAHTADEYLTAIASEVLEPERGEIKRERGARIAGKVDALPPARRAELLAELGES